jgi:pSer/pThr/pTyr-binding forkhead associated (FHA) protein
VSTRLALYKQNGVLDKAFPVFEEGLTGIGRESGNLIQLEDARVSKQHAVLKRDKEQWFIEDVGSRNGVLVNGSRVRRSALKHGDRIAIGPYQFIFETDVQRSNWVPDHVINRETVASQRTIVGVNVGDVKPKTT